MTKLLKHQGKKNYKKIKTTLVVFSQGIHLVLEVVIIQDGITRQLTSEVLVFQQEHHEKETCSFFNKGNMSGFNHRNRNPKKNINSLTQ